MQGSQKMCTFAAAKPRCSAVGSVPGLGPGCRRFESCHLDSHNEPLIQKESAVFSCHLQNPVLDLLTKTIITPVNGNSLSDFCCTLSAIAIMSKLTCHYPLNCCIFLSSGPAIVRKNSENRRQSQTCLSYAEVHPVLRIAKNPASLKNHSP